MRHCQFVDCGNAETPEHGARARIHRDDLVPVPRLARYSVLSSLENTAAWMRPASLARGVSVSHLPISVSSWVSITSYIVGSVQADRDEIAAGAGVDVVRT